MLKYIQEVYSDQTMLKIYDSANNNKIIKSAFLTGNETRAFLSDFYAICEQFPIKGTGHNETLKIINHHIELKREKLRCKN